MWKVNHAYDRDLRYSAVSKNLLLEDINHIGILTVALRHHCHTMHLSAGVLAFAPEATKSRHTTHHRCSDIIQTSDITPNQVLQQHQLLPGRIKLAMCEVQDLEQGAD